MYFDCSCSYILYINFTNLTQFWLCAEAHIHSPARWKPRDSPNTSVAKGWAWFVQTNNTIWYKLNVTGLDRVVGAHIHNGRADENGDPIVALFHSGTPTGPVNGTLVEGNLTSAQSAPSSRICE